MQVVGDANTSGDLLSFCADGGEVLMQRLFRVEARAGCWCSTRSPFNFEICGAVPKYRFKIYWSVPTYRLDWIVQGYAGPARWHLWG
jgi:hypothetical protein